MTDIMDRSPEPINLIYIASIGRSGSTLLESMLGAHSQIETTGEVQIWPHEIMQGGVLPVGSGLMINEDPFWIEMKKRLDPLKQASPQIHHFREKHYAGRTLRLDRLGDFKTDSLQPEVDAMMRQYARNNHELFTVFADVVEEQSGTRPTWLVDASKDVYRLLWLLKSGLFNIKVIQMVKSPRGFVYSVTKQYLDREIQNHNVKRLYYGARQSLAWTTQNELFRKVASSHVDDDDYMLLKYETLAAQPYDTFEKVCNLVGCEYESRAVDTFRDGSSYSMAGNPMRHKTGGIVLDERWKALLPDSSKRLAQLVTSRNRQHFGYE